MPSPIVELNRAVALSMAVGPAAGLELVEQLAVEPAMQGYHLLHSVRATCWRSSGDPTEAAASSRARPS